LFTYFNLSLYYYCNNVLPQRQDEPWCEMKQLFKLVLVPLWWTASLSLCSSWQRISQPSQKQATALYQQQLSPNTHDDGHHGPVHTLLLCRHGDSIWNGGEPGTRETFTGWTDVPLSQKGIREAKTTGRQVSSYNFGIDACFTSNLQRAQLTAHYCLFAFAEQSPELGPKQYVMDYRLNERHYGALQGFVKADVEAGMYGHDAEMVQQWRRSWHTVPPLLEDDDPRRIQELRRFSSLCNGAENVPKGESLEQVAKHRIQPFLNDKLVPTLNQAAGYNKMDGQQQYRNATGLVVAHANSLRALIGVICEVQNDPMALKTLEAMKLPTGVPLVAKFRQRNDGSFQVCDMKGRPYDLYIGSGEATPDLPVWPLASLPLKPSSPSDQSASTSETRSTKSVKERVKSGVLR
jgi:2,3-bisphosphoglycerate-dependent phosphoglycerate mutase